ncbi:hypothetical protein QJQ45_001558 [Haematococcus lacustris]|nr:hypothetical protein QJQ45_001558 [Haematococcus lacustris]
MSRHSVEIVVESASEDDIRTAFTCCICLDVAQLPCNLTAFRCAGAALTCSNSYTLNFNIMDVMSALQMKGYCRPCGMTFSSQHDLLQHYKHDCPQAVLPCPYQGCTHTATRSQLVAHVPFCPVGRTQCSQCQEWVEHAKLLHHLATACKQRLVPCMLCPHRAPVSLMLLHLRQHRLQLQLQGQLGQGDQGQGAALPTSAPCPPALPTASSSGSATISAQHGNAAPSRPLASLPHSLPPDPPPPASPSATVSAASIQSTRSEWDRRPPVAAVPTMHNVAMLPLATATSTQTAYQAAVASQALSTQPAVQEATLHPAAPQLVRHAQTHDRMRPPAVPPPARSASLVQTLPAAPSASTALAPDHASRRPTARMLHQLLGRLRHPINHVAAPQPPATSSPPKLARLGAWQGGGRGGQQGQGSVDSQPEQETHRAGAPSRAPPLPSSQPLLATAGPPVPPVPRVAGQPSAALQQCLLLQMQVSALTTLARSRQAAARLIPNVTAMAEAQALRRSMSFDPTRARQPSLQDMQSVVDDMASSLQHGLMALRDESTWEEGEAWEGEVVGGGAEEQGSVGRASSSSGTLVSHGSCEDQPHAAADDADDNDEASCTQTAQETVACLHHQTSSDSDRSSSEESTATTGNSLEPLCDHMAHRGQGEAGCALPLHIAQPSSTAALGAGSEEGEQVQQPMAVARGPSPSGSPAANAFLQPRPWPDRILALAYGAASFSGSGSVGCRGVPVSQMRKEAVKQFGAGRVVLVEEFRTSRVSSAYSSPSEALPGQPPESFRWLRPVYSKAKRSQVRGLMSSTSHNIRFYDRDVSAALTIRRCAVGPGPRPTELCYWDGRPAMPKRGRPGQEWVYLPDKALLRKWRRKWRQ